MPRINLLLNRENSLTLLSGGVGLPSARLVAGRRPIFIDSYRMIVRRRLSNNFKLILKQLRDQYSQYRLHPLFRIWMSMFYRTNIKVSGIAAKGYSERGIKICLRWWNFENFIADMGPKPKTYGIVLVRRDQSKGYEPSNCQWDYAASQASARANTVKVTYQGKEYPLTVFVNRMGLYMPVFSAAIKRGADVSTAIALSDEYLRKQALAVADLRRRDAELKANTKKAKRVEALVKSSVYRKF